MPPRLRGQCGSRGACRRQFPEARYPTLVFAKLLLLFILVPVAELNLFLTLGREIGIVPTLVIIVLTAILGASLTRSQGAREAPALRLVGLCQPALDF